ncbi:MAG: helix-turn-helix domain-containing protein, partial [Calditrichaeota bacterium]|nr:helix-turn-helix domain-containing protein [Calditrichota bacterium]
PDTQQLRSLLPSGEEKPFQHSNDYEVSPSVPFQAETETPPEEVDTRDLRPIILSDKAQQSYDESEVIEENLSLADNEKELIRKALKKHNGRRKEAAADLGISERTLYRKIKEYDL